MDDASDNPFPLRPPLNNSAKPRENEPKEMEKLRTWYEERQKRKLKGEYESAVVHLSEVINENLDAPLRVSSVRVNGAVHTRAIFLDWLIRPHLKASSPHTSSSDAPDATDTKNTTAASYGTLQSALHTARGISDVLQQTDMFHLVDARIERARDALATHGDVDIVLRTKEKGRLFVKTSTEVGNNEGNASLTARLRNTLGLADVLSAEISLGTTTKRSFQGAWGLPVSPDLRTRAEVSVYGMERDLSSYASCREEVRAVRGCVRRGTELERGGKHEVAYELVQRNIGTLGPEASFSIRQSAGPSLKSAFSHTWTKDTRDDRVQGSSGFYSKVSTEIAGLSELLGGSGATSSSGVAGEGKQKPQDAGLRSASHVKVEGEGSVGRSLTWLGLDGVHLHLASRAGILLTPFTAPSPPSVSDSKEPTSIGSTAPIAPTPKRQQTLFPDRFQLGGPISVRAFRSNGMGGREGADSLGGDVYWSAGASLISNIPRKGHWPVKSHMWVNAGRLDSLDRGIPLTQNLASLLARPSISAGVGLMYKFDPVRVELNFGVPLVVSKGELGRRGVQVGMGVEFL